MEEARGALYASGRAGSAETTRMQDEDARFEELYSMSILSAQMCAIVHAASTIYCVGKAVEHLDAAGKALERPGRQGAWGVRTYRWQAPQVWPMPPSMGWGHEAPGENGALCRQGRQIWPVT